MRKRSSYKPKPVVMPLNTKKLDMLELPGHIALQAIGQPWWNEAHLADLKAHVVLAFLVARKVDNEQVQDIAIKALEILSKHEFTKEDVTPLLGVTLEWLSNQSNKLIYQEVLEAMKCPTIQLSK